MEPLKWEEFIVMKLKPKNQQPSNRVVFQPKFFPLEKFSEGIEATKCGSFTVKRIIKK